MSQFLRMLTIWIAKDIIFNAYFTFLILKIQVLLPCFYYKNLYVSSNDFRWFDEKVSSLELSAPLTILPELSVEQALSIMNNEGFDQLPVIESSGYAIF